jgi:hypothetical protein
MQRDKKALRTNFPRFIEHLHISAVHYSMSMMERNLCSPVRRECTESLYKE